MTYDRITVFVGSTEPTPEIRRAMQKRFDLQQAKDAAYTWRNLFCLSWLIFAVCLAWPWLVGFWELAAVWVKR